MRASTREQLFPEMTPECSWRYRCPWRQEQKAISFESSKTVCSAIGQSERKLEGGDSIKKKLEYSPQLVSSECFISSPRDFQFGPMLYCNKGEKNPYPKYRLRDLGPSTWHLLSQLYYPLFRYPRFQFFYYPFIVIYS